MQIQLPNDALSVGYTQTRPFHFEQVFESKSVGFKGTERQFVEAGYGYAYVQTGPHTRCMVSL
jgi:hypothetical protein